MARIRTVKPDLWKHEDLSALPEATHLLAAALLNYADDEGYFNANPALVKAECCPLREPSVSIHASLTELSNIGYLRLGTGPDGRKYGHIVNFLEHQRINRPTPSKISKLDIVWEDSLRTHGGLTEDSLPEGKGKEGNGIDMSSSGTHSTDISEVFDHWKEVHGHPRAKLDDKRRACIRKALKSYSAEDLKLAIDGCKRSDFHQGRGPDSNGTVYDAITLILRDGDHIDKFIRLASPEAAQQMRTL